jgi:hypothetical protein
MAQNDQDARYLTSLQQGSFSKEERLKLAQGTTFEGTPTPPGILARLCVDSELVVRVQSKKSILRLPEESLVRIASDNSTSPEVLLFLAKHFHDSPAVGTAIIGNKNTTEKVLYYLQGEIEEGEEERESVFAGNTAEQEVEFEVEDVISSEREAATDDNVEVTVELDDKPSGGGRFSERERYSDDDIEVVIGVDEGQDEIIDEDLLERNIADRDNVVGKSAEPSGGSGADDQDFSAAVDAIEGTFDDVFQVDSGPKDAPGPDLVITGNDEFTASSGGGDDMTIGAMWGDREPEPASQGPSGQDRRAGTAKVMMNETRKEVAVDTGKFVARLPMGRYFYKVSPFEIFSRIIRISIPIIAAIVILGFFWFLLPTSHPSVEELEGGVNRVLYSIKQDGLDSKITDPFPPGSIVTSWEFVSSSPETEVARGGLRKALESFAATYSEEIDYDATRSELSQEERTQKEDAERIAEIDETVNVLNADKAKYINLQSRNRLDSASIEEEYQKEVKAFKEDFTALEDQVKSIEKDMAAARKRIAEYESLYGAGGNDPGYIANKMELDDLAVRYGRLKPLYDKRKAGYEARLLAIRQQYQNMLDDAVWLETVDAHLKELQQERIRLSSENGILEKEIKKLKENLKGLEVERSKRPKLTGENLFTFLVLSHYMHETDIRAIDEIPLLERYTIYKTVSTVNIGTTLKGNEEEKRYALTFMRLEAEKSVILFSWGKYSTTWVLTSITASK